MLFVLEIEIEEATQIQKPKTKPNPIPLAQLATLFSLYPRGPSSPPSLPAPAQALRPTLSHALGPLQPRRPHLSLSLSSRARWQDLPLPPPKIVAGLPAPPAPRPAAPWVIPDLAGPLASHPCTFSF